MPLAPIPMDAMEKFGVGLDRPEDVVVGSDGRVWASDHQCACAEILPDGSLRRVGHTPGAPNGINMDAQHRIIIANFGIYDQVPGPLQRLDTETGDVEVLAAGIDGKTLTSCNYPAIARDGTIWCTHSTWAGTWPEALDGRADGFVFRLTPGGKVCVEADGLKFANGCCLDRDETHLYVNQTSGGNVVRFPILADGSLGVQEDYGPQLGVIPGHLDPDNFPVQEEMSTWGFTDGNGFDVEGNLWVTLPAAAKIIAITPERKVITIAHDPTAQLMPQPTNVTWGGTDMRDLYIGSISSDYVLKTRSPVPGLPMLHQS